MDYLTMRLLLPREAVVSLLDEPAFEGCLSLTAQRDVKPFSDVYLTKPDSPSMDLLRAHFRGEEAFVHKTFIDIGYQLPIWRNHHRNCAGDLDPLPEIIVEDP